MLRFTCTLLFTFFLTSAVAQVGHTAPDTLKATLTKIFQTVKRNSVYRQQVDWNKLENVVLNEAAMPLSFDDFKRNVILLFSGIGDKHAALFVKGRRLSAMPPPTELRSTLIYELKTNKPQLHTQLLNDRYGYIFIPSNTPKDNIQQLAQAIQDSLCRLIKGSLKGVIIDLRANEGGSIYPLFTGLHQLIGDGVFGAFSNLDGTFRTQWILEKGKFSQQKKIVASVKPTCICSEKIPVAVLLSQITASAGEMVAIALKGRANTIFIGEKTYGLTTGNATFNIDGYLLAVSASFSEDRKGNVYNNYVTPDIELIEGDNFSNISEDKKVMEAMQWFDFRKNR